MTWLDGVSRLLFAYLLATFLSAFLAWALQTSVPVVKLVAALVWLSIVYLQTFASWGAVVGEHLPAIGELYANLKFLTLDLRAFDFECLSGMRSLVGLYIVRNLLPWLLVVPFVVGSIVCKALPKPLQQSWKLGSSTFVGGYCM